MHACIHIRLSTVPLVVANFPPPRIPPNRRTHLRARRTNVASSEYLPYCGISNFALERTCLRS